MNLITFHLRCWVLRPLASRTSRLLSKHGRINTTDKNTQKSLGSSTNTGFEAQPLGPMPEVHSWQNNESLPPVAPIETKTQAPASQPVIAPRLSTSDSISIHLECAKYLKQHIHQQHGASLSTRSHVGQELIINMKSRFERDASRDENY